MEIIEVKNVKNLLKDTKYVGKGTTAKCFCNKQGEVIKLYSNNYEAKYLLDFSDMYERLETINGIQNDSYIGPKKILVKDDTIIGYIYDYINAKTFRHISLNTSLSDLYKHYDKLIKDTKDISSKHFKLIDVHSKNILFNDYYYVIDLDKGKIVEYDPLVNNSMTIAHILMGHIFKFAPWEIVTFEDCELDNKYRETSWDEEESVKDLFKVIEVKCKYNNPTIRQLRKIKRYKYENSYYKD